MNIAYFLIPKNSVAYLYDDFTFRQGLEKMRHHGYTAIPVISRDGRYVGTASEGDFLWRLLSEDAEHPRPCSMRDMEQLRVRDPAKQQLPARTDHRGYGAAAAQRHEPEFHPRGG